MTAGLGQAFRGRRVLVTGHTGFKGAWLTAWLRHMGAEVYGYSLPPNGPASLYGSIGLQSDVQERYGDIADLDSLRASFNAFQPDLVFHLAAQALVRTSHREPVQTYATNVMGTVHVLQAVRETSSVRGVVVVTSDKCYDNREWAWPYREVDRLGGWDPYSSSKACAELVASSYRQSFFREPSAPLIATCRAGNVIGGCDWAEDRIVPDAARAILSGQPVLVRNPNAVRPWQHVLEPLRGYLMVAQRLLQGDSEFADAWNFGPDPGTESTVIELAGMIVAEWGRGEVSILPQTNPVHEAAVLRLDSTKARVALGWVPALDLRQAVRWTVECYRAQERELPALVVHQIERYMDLCASARYKESRAG